MTQQIRKNTVSTKCSIYSFLNSKSLLNIEKIGNTLVLPSFALHMPASPYPSPNAMAIILCEAPKVGAFVWRNLFPDVSSSLGVWI